MLQFVRQIPLQIVFEKTLLPRRGFLFYLAAGFSKEVDPLSGMTVNLTHVDEWLRDLKAEVEAKSWPVMSWQQVMAFLRENLSRKAATEGAQLSSLTLREERHWQIFWSSALAPDEIEFRQMHYLELFSESGFDLLQVSLNWRQREAGTQDRLFHEGLQLLKTLQSLSADEVQGALRSLLGTHLESGTELCSIDINYLSRNYSLKLS